MNDIAQPLGILRNRVFDEIAVGDSASMVRTLSARDIQLFAVLSGDVNPQHLDAEFAASTQFQGVIAHGMWGGALISAVLGTRLPGPGTVYRGQTLRFLAPIRVGDALSIRVEVISKQADYEVTLRCTCVNQHGTSVIDGEARVLAPVERIERASATLPEVRFATVADGSRRLLEYARSLGTVRMAVVHSCDALSLGGVLDARAAGLIEPVLVAPRARLEIAAREGGFELAGVEIEDVPHSHAAAARAVELAGRGQVEALMKGSLHTDELMGAVLVASAGLRTKRRVSHCFVMQTPAYPRPFIITDAAVNIAPTLLEKVDIVNNAIDLAHAIGVAEPRVAILAAVETVNASMPATLDAAALCKMADRGQIQGAVLDGPLAFDNAVSAAAARVKGIRSPVAGQADVLVVPDLESGNMLAKQLEYMGDATSAGIVLGARVPIVLTSRADSRESRMASCAIAVLLAHRYRTSPP
ncbi:MAG: bifunctional enoyl-CoA hydratase/phosphate acetyltransferase [Gammaproteobacteria bacterium]|nr:bifunctional enoyl-CoA hydratase/phosphate acetyltransferase [Gammaproteobacteria bacterium]